ncbi:MAG: hypothetical protein R3Y12_05645 [Clostridia bacterium]
MIRILRVLVVFALILMIPAYAFYNYTTHNPQFFIVSNFTASEETYHYEQVSFAYATFLQIPMDLEILENLLEIATWNDEIISEMAIIATDAEYLDIRGYYDEIDGTTTVKYLGTITYDDGETLAYHEEQTFDFTLPLTENQMSSDR